MNMTDRWWILVLRAVVAIAFVALALASPLETRKVLALLFGAYAFLDGVGSLVLGWRRAGHDRPWAWFVVAGVVGVVAGSLSIVQPGSVLLGMPTLVALWALLTGVAEIGIWRSGRRTPAAHPSPARA
jgi:uncharacterized membrane protein HdeD (DUF308 family)